MPRKQKRNGEAAAISIPPPSQGRCRIHAMAVITRAADSDSSRLPESGCTGSGARRHRILCCETKKKNCLILIIYGYSELLTQSKYKSGRACGGEKQQNPANKTEAPRCHFVRLMSSLKCSCQSILTFKQHQHFDIELRWIRNDFTVLEFSNNGELLKLDNFNIIITL